MIKNTRSLKGPRHIFGKVLDSDHFDQYLKYSVYEKAEEILYKFFMKSPHKKHFYNKTLPTTLKIPLDTGRKLNVHKTFRRSPGHLLNVLCTFNLRPVSTGISRREAPLAYCLRSYLQENDPSLIV